jgi:NAD(P)-dependent dehydrogenase (short-subunit alcohol dehydrogenase family)
MRKRTYLITASSGIGGETAKLLAQQRANLFVAGRDLSKCQVMTDQLRSLGGEADFLAGDLTDPWFAAKLTAACVERFGRIDALFNVAGISGRKFGDGPVHECTEEGWTVTLETNATTQYRMCREVVRIMLGQEPFENEQRGVILNMSSVLALHPEPLHFNTVAYAASKGAIIAMSRTMAAGYAKNRIRVNVIAPSLVHTPMSARASEDPEILEFMKQKQPLLQGVIPATDVASICMFLLTDLSRAMTGEVVKVDAGWSAA